MNNIIKNIALSGIVAAGLGMGLTSCEDFLTITPSSSIVEEEFWKDKNDLNNQVYACYKRLAADDILGNYIQWGEARSDNFEVSASVNRTSPLYNIMNANLIPTYYQFNWTGMYNAINYCNKILAHGPEVIANDESFSEADWQPIKAEAVTLRAYCHFWLVRTFGEIPYITIDYNNDNQDLLMGQSTQLQVLDNIIADLESVKDAAMNNYGNTVLNKGRITKKAVYALLADVYLWRASYKAGNCHPFTKLGIANNYKGELQDGDVRTEVYSTTAESDYQKCVDCCDMVINIVKKEKLDFINKYGLNIGGAEIELDDDDLLVQNLSPSQMGLSVIKNYITEASLGTYNKVFGQGNSDESIFELQIEGSQSFANGMLNSTFYNTKDSKVGSMTGSVAILDQKLEDVNIDAPQSLFSVTDYRKWTTFRYMAEQTTFDLAKGTYSSIKLTDKTTNNEMRSNESEKVKVVTTAQSYNSDGAYSTNWIVYRMPEIFLMKAEALSQLSAEEENLQEAFHYIETVFKRSNPYAYMTTNPKTEQDKLKFDAFNSQAGIEALVMAERQREFIGEGKRWFDLVRYAQRHGNTQDMLRMLTRKYSSNKKAVESKLAHMQTLFSPVYNNEIKNNSLLYQNGVWKVNESSSQTDNM